MLAEYHQWLLKNNFLTKKAKKLIIIYTNKLRYQTIKVNMANQFSTTITIIAQEGQSLTVNGPSGQDVTVTGAIGKVTAIFTSQLANMAPDEPMINIEQPFNIGQADPWSEIEQMRKETVTLYEIQRQKEFLELKNTLSSQYTKIHIMEFAAIRNRDRETFNRIFRLHNLNKRQHDNVMNKIRREDPEYRSNQNMNQCMSYARRRDAANQE